MVSQAGSGPFLGIVPSPSGVLNEHLLPRFVFNRSQLVIDIGNSESIYTTAAYNAEGFFFSFSFLESCLLNIYLHTTVSHGFPCHPKELCTWGNPRDQLFSQDVLELLAQEGTYKILL